MRSDGLKIKLTRIPGLTPKGVLDTPYYFQCPPQDEVTSNFGHNSTTYTTIPSTGEGGEYKRVGGRKLRVIQFSTLVVDFAGFIIASHFNRNVENDTVDMDVLCDNIQEISEKSAIFRLQGSHDWRDGVEFAWPATLPDLGIVERGGETDTRYLNISFEEWRQGITAARNKRVGGKTWPKTHVLDANDTLYSLAKQYYGKEGAGRPGAEAIAKANHITKWGFGDKLVDSKRFNKGDKIKIPQMRLVATKSGGSGSVGI